MSIYALFQGLEDVEGRKMRYVKLRPGHPPRLRRRKARVPVDPAITVAAFKPRYHSQTESGAAVLRSRHPGPVQSQP